MKIITIQKIKAFMKAHYKIFGISAGFIIVLAIILFIAMNLNTRKINNDIPLIVDYTYNSDMEQDLVKMTQLSLLTTDKDGNIVNKGNTCNVSQKYDSEKDITKIEIKLHSNLEFSDNKKVTADDVIFSYYWLIEEKANRNSAVANLPFVGLDEYLYHTSNTKDILTAAQAELDNPSDDTKALIADNVIAPFLKNQFEWVKTLYGNPKYSDLTNKYPKAKDLFAYLYAPKEKYNSNNYDDNSVLSEVISEYGYDYDTLGYAFSGDYDYFKKDALKQAVEVVSKKIDRGNNVSEIAGIKKVNNSTVEITLKGYNSSYLYDLCDVYVLPKHKYNSTAEVGNTIDCTIGAGMYTLQERNDSQIKLSANHRYYGEKPYNTNVILTNNSKPDNAFSFTNETNSYCYVGFNVNNVNVKGDALSQESCELRSNLSKAFIQDISGVTLTPAEYTIYICAGGTGNHPAMDSLKAASSRLEKLGVKLTIKDVADESTMWDAVNSGKAQMWCAVWNENGFPQLKQKYNSASINEKDSALNPYKINSPDLDRMIDDFNSCKNISELPTKREQIQSKIDSYAIEQILYYKEKTVLLSPEPINAEQIFKNVNRNYDWVNELGNIKIVE